ncbi:Uncharacterised protein [Bergeriella denitrificans]|uniref:Uncharacterized protein n=2 Tax=Bergeriella denitrificans TaxID=494 RepID=A0A378UKY3_BERDE|nr:hypothetical protein [Bergeriella denitrificans]STZ77299.1 Uncharacterised protein [Bergeriella denitrificans]
MLPTPPREYRTAQALAAVAFLMPALLQNLPLPAAQGAGGLWLALAAAAAYAVYLPATVKVRPAVCSGAAATALGLYLLLFAYIHQAAANGNSESVMLWLLYVWCSAGMLAASLVLALWQPQAAQRSAAAAGLYGAGFALLGSVMPVIGVRLWI